MGKYIMMFWAAVTFVLAVWSVSSALFDKEWGRLTSRLGLAIVWPLALFSHGGITGLWAQFKNVYNVEEK